MLHSMSFVVLFVGCFLLYFNVVTYVETLDSLAPGIENSYKWGILFRYNSYLQRLVLEAKIGNLRSEGVLPPASMVSSEVPERPSTPDNLPTSLEAQLRSEIAANDSPNPVSSEPPPPPPTTMSSDDHGKLIYKSRAWLSRINYFENERQTLSSHL